MFREHEGELQHWVPRSVLWHIPAGEACPCPVATESQQDFGAFAQGCRSYLEAKMGVFIERLGVKGKWGCLHQAGVCGLQRELLLSVVWLWTCVGSWALGLLLIKGPALLIVGKTMGVQLHVMPQHC
jgi:hypothetical protein